MPCTVGAISTEHGCGVASEGEMCGRDHEQGLGDGVPKQRNFIDARILPGRQSRNVVQVEGLFLNVCVVTVLHLSICPSTAELMKSTRTAEPADHSSIVDTDYQTCTISNGHAPLLRLLWCKDTSQTVTMSMNIVHSAIRSISLELRPHPSLSPIGRRQGLALWCAIKFPAYDT